MRWKMMFLLGASVICGSSDAFAQNYKSLPSISDAPAAAAAARGGPLGNLDLERIVSTYKANQMRFARDFKGKPFVGVSPFKSAEEEIISKGAYRIGLGSGSFMSDIDCTFSDPADIQRMSDWNPGDQISVTGTIKDVTFGSLQLDPCTMEKK